MPKLKRWRPAKHEQRSPPLNTKYELHSPKRAFQSYRRIVRQIDRGPPGKEPQMPRLGNPFPIRPNTIPANHCIRRHGAIGQEVIIAHPAIRFHDTRIVEVIPGAIFIQPARDHSARAVQVIPRPRDRTPSRRHSAVRAKPIPRRTIVVPARLHRSAVIEEIPLAIDFASTSRHCAVGIDHPKVSIALDKNRIHVFKRQNINAGTAARLGGLRQSDIRAKKERWRTSTRQRTTSRRAASFA